MTKITKEEALKIANSSQLELHEDEIGPLLKHLEDVLSYAERVKEVAADVQEPSNCNINVFREDVSKQCDAELILSKAPEREENYFVVPVILENNEG